MSSRRCRSNGARKLLGSEHAYESVFRDLIKGAQTEGLARVDLDPRLAALSILGSTNWFTGGMTRPELRSALTISKLA